MMTDQVRTGVTEEELMRLENAWTEVVDGVLVEIYTDLEGSNIIDHLIFVLKPFVVRQKLGLVHTDGVKYILHINENGIQTSFKPDLAFVRIGRIPLDFDRYRRPFPGAPNLAVEVVPPGQSSPDILGKVADYLRYGTEEVWVIYPMKRELHCYRGGKEVPEVYQDTHTFQPEGLFPGLKIKIADLFEVEGQ
jgi:Uma2 family endonuclease